MAEVLLSPDISVGATEVIVDVWTCELPTAISQQFLYELEWVGSEGAATAGSLLVSLAVLLN